MSETTKHRPHVNPGRPRSALISPMLAMMATMGGLGMGLGDAMRENDLTPRPDKAAPEYVKTPEDLARLAKAEEKRNQKNAKRGLTPS